MVNNIIYLRTGAWLEGEMASDVAASGGKIQGAAKWA
jgi:hypothetical protein